MTDIKKKLLLDACVAARPDVWDEYGAPRAGQSPARVEMVAEEIERAMAVFWTATTSAPEAAYVIELEDRAREAERKAGQRVQELGVQAAEHEAALRASERRMQGMLDTVRESREQAIRDREKAVQEKADTEALLVRAERDLLAARGAQPSGERPHSAQDLFAQFQKLMQDRGGSSGSNPFEELFRSSGSGSPIDDLFKQISKLFGDDEDGKGRGGKR